jgi:bifunctional DNA-binding transcriptional regulator/antitoxin component of YhaV-PrlF toxin-antitoxin module
MSNGISTITSKWQVTIPEEVRKDMPLQVGQRIAWSVQGDKIIGQRVLSILELAGCLKSDPVVTGGAEGPDELSQAALARHERLTRESA